MMLSELIEYLERADQSLVVPMGFGRPHSYRGRYTDLAFVPQANVMVGAMLADARKALGCRLVTSGRRA